jgi:hypothetical protein
MANRHWYTVTTAVILGGITYAILPAPEDAMAVPGTTTSYQIVNVIDAVHDLSPPLRELAPASVVASAPTSTTSDAIQPLAHTGLNVVENFDGIATPAGSTSTWASDANADVGHDFVMEATNFSAAIYAKDGSVVMSPFATSTFWSGFSAPCGGTWSDVIVLCDQAADRWFVSRFARQNSNSPLNWYQCFAISQTADPTGPYFRYAFLIDAEEFNDYPKFGIWPDGYYMAADRDKIFPGVGNFVAAFEREQMLAGQVAQAIVMTIDNNGNRAGMLPADWDGDTPPPADSPGWFVKTIDDNIGWPADALEIWSLEVDWTAGTAFQSLGADDDWVCTTPGIGGTGDGLCSLDELDAGDTATIEVVGLVNCTTPDGTLIVNSVDAIADTPPDSDPGNNSESASFTVDNPVPVITASVETDSLMQNPHDLEAVGLQASATDGPCPVPPLVVTVHSDEDDEEHGSSSQFSPDATEIAPGTLRLRAERVGMADGRVYLIVVSATDEAGGTGFATLTVTVPKSSSPEDTAAVEAEAAAARAFADANDGQPPPGYTLVGDGPVIGPKQ